MNKRAFMFMVAMIVIGSISAQSLAAAEYPSKPVEVVVPFTAGGTNDLLMRLVAQIAPKYLGQPLVIVNKGGAGGTLGAADVIGSKPDGYKLISVPSNFFSTTVHMQKIPFNPNDLVPVANFMEYKNGLVVKGNAPWKTLNDLLDYGRKNPGKLRWAHMNRGSALAIQTFLIFKKAGITTIEVPYPGLPECLNALLGGHVDAAPVSYGGTRDHVKAGNVRYLVTYSEKRYSEPANIPCAPELGFPEAGKVRTFISIYAHKNVPEDVKKTLFTAFKKTYDDPEFKKAFEVFGEAPLFLGPEPVKEEIQEETKITVPLLKEWGLYVGK
jgi:tripartite-type tricarboxylate transporter receptor subunit TctC